MVFAYRDKLEYSHQGIMTSTEMVDAGQSAVQLENFHINIGESVILGQITYLEKSCMVWIGVHGTPPMMSSLQMALPNRFDNDPLSTVVFDDAQTGSTGVSNGIMQRLTKKFSIQIFMSYNVPETLDEDAIQIERKLLELLKPRYETR